MNEKDIERMLAENELDMSHIKKDDVLAKAKQEIYFGNKADAKPEKERRSLPLLFTKKRFVAALAGVALAFTLCAGMIGLYNENFQTLYIDINPSVALKLNRFERVIGVEFLNEEAATLLANTNLVGCDAENALKTVISTCDEAGYVNQNREIYISASSKEEESSEKLLKKLKGTAEKIKPKDNETYSVNTYNAKGEEKEKIKNSDISPAKYKIIEEIIEEDRSYRIEDLKNKTMGELKYIYKTLDEDFDDFDDFDHDDRDDDHDDDRNEKPKNEPNNRDDDHDDDRDEDRDDDDRDDDDDDDDHGKKEEHKNNKEKD